MKKILLLLLCLCFCLPLVACGGTEEPADGAHTHTASVGYANDDRHHWNPCTVEGCNIKMNWGEHAFGEGIVTTLPTEETDGVMTYTCVCGHKKTEAVSFEGVDNMIFSAAVMDEQMSNVCVRAIATEGTETVTELTVCFDGNLMSVSGKLNGQTLSETVDDVIRVESCRQVLLFVKQLTAYDLVYDEENKLYAAQRELQVSSGDGVTRSFSNIGLKLSKNLISYVSCDYTVSDGSGITASVRLELMLYDYGQVALQ